MTEKTDELMALLALGVLASFAIFFQYGKDFSQFFGLPPLAGSSPLVQAEVYTESAVAFFFGLYVVWLTLSLGFDRFVKFKSFSRGLKWLSDVFFVFGAMSLLAVCLAYLVRIVAAKA